MRCQFDFRPYRRKFLRAVITSHGIWDTREGIILRLSDETGKIGWGEIAPISWFGSETLEQALTFCQQLPKEITPKIIFSIPDTLPASQFGFESAFEQLSPNRINSAFCMKSSGLLPAGESVLEAWQSLWHQGYSTMKWKIGVYPTDLELEILRLLVQKLPASAKLRLDANGKLSYKQAQLWLATCDELNTSQELTAEVEFMEQPLAVEEFAAMLELSGLYQTAIALDESAATLKQLENCFQQGWRGIFIIKPAIAGSPFYLRQFCRQHNIDAVFSSVFETSIGRKAALQLAAELSPANPRALGFGVNHYFDADNESAWLENLW
jgi:O-succinylbenzoate synthase